MAAHAGGDRGRNRHADVRVLDIVANSWMQTPAGYEMRTGSPIRSIGWRSSSIRVSCTGSPIMVTAAYLTTSFRGAGVGARYMLAGHHLEHARTMIRTGVAFAAIVAPLQAFIGDQHGLNTLKHQPLKIAAIESALDGTQPGELVLSRGRTRRRKTNRFAITIPHGASLMLTHSWNGLFTGLTAYRPRIGRRQAALLRVPRDGRPLPANDPGGMDWHLLMAPAAPVHGAMVSLACAARLVDRIRRGDLRLIVTETGRQPWVAYGLLRTADAASRSRRMQWRRRWCCSCWSTASCSRWNLLHQSSHRARTAGFTDRVRPIPRRSRHHPPNWRRSAG